MLFRSSKSALIPGPVEFLIVGLGNPGSDGPTFLRSPFVFRGASSAGNGLACRLGRVGTRPTGAPPLHPWTCLLLTST